MTTKTILSMGECMVIFPANNSTVTFRIVGAEAQQLFERCNRTTQQSSQGSGATQTHQGDSRSRSRSRAPEPQGKPQAQNAQIPPSMAKNMPKPAAKPHGEAPQPNRSQGPQGLEKKVEQAGSGPGTQKAQDEDVPLVDIIDKRLKTDTLFEIAPLRMSLATRVCLTIFYGQEYDVTNMKKVADMFKDPKVASNPLDIFEIDKKKNFNEYFSILRGLAGWVNVSQTNPLLRKSSACVLELLAIHGFTYDKIVKSKGLTFPSSVNWAGLYDFVKSGKALDSDVCSDVSTDLWYQFPAFPVSVGGGKFVTLTDPEQYEGGLFRNPEGKVCLFAMPETVSETGKEYNCVKYLTQPDEAIYAELMARNVRLTGASVAVSVHTSPEQKVAEAKSSTTAPEIVIKYADFLGDNVEKVFLFASQEASAKGMNIEEYVNERFEEYKAQGYDLRVNKVINDVRKKMAFLRKPRSGQAEQPP